MPQRIPQNQITSDAEKSQSQKLRSRILRELFLGYGLILLAIWTPNPLQTLCIWTAFFYILWVTVAHPDNRRELGFGWRGLLGSSWILLSAALFSAVSIELARRMGTLHMLHGRTSIASHIAGYGIWSLFQQFLLQGYFLNRLLRLVDNRNRAAFLATLMFASAHLPNPVLIAATLVWGWVACQIFLRWRNLYTLGVAHALLGLTVAITVPDAVQHNMRVGLGYWMYHRPAHTHMVVQEK